MAQRAAAPHRFPTLAEMGAQMEPAMRAALLALPDPVWQLACDYVDHTFRRSDAAAKKRWILHILHAAVSGAEGFPIWHRAEIAELRAALEAE